MTTPREQIAAAVDALEAEADQLLAERDAARKETADQREMALQRIANLQAEVDDLRAQLVRLQPKPTRFGACPMKPGGTSLAAAQTVIDKWGKGAAVRQFLATGTAARPADASIVHISWKPTLAQITDDWVARVTTNLRPGDCVEVWHEADSKVAKGSLKYDDAVARKNQFHDAVKRVRPDLLVVNTVTGWLTDPKSNGDVDRWGAVRADVFGIDCDGVRPTQLPYTDYHSETTTALEFIERHKAQGYRWFAVPEFGCPRIPTQDPDGTIRAEYHQHYADLWRESGRCLFACLYEYDSSPHYSLTTPAEIQQWRSLVA